MNNKHSKGILTAIMAFYILTSVMAVGVFGRAGTVYGMNWDSSPSKEKDGDKDADLGKNGGEEQDASGEEAPKIVVEDGVYGIDEETVREVNSYGKDYGSMDWSDLYDAIDETDEMVSDFYELKEDLGFNEEDAEAVSEADAGVLDETDAGDASGSKADSDLADSNADKEDEKYYTFVSNNTSTTLNMRKEPDIDSTVVYRIDPGSKGLIIELMDEWSKVEINGNTGYCANEFLTMKEVTKEDYEEFQEEMKKAVEKRAEEKAAAAAAQQTLPVLDPSILNGLPAFDPSAVTALPEADPSLLQQAPATDPTQQTGLTLPDQTAVIDQNAVTDQTAVSQ